MPQGSVLGRQKEDACATRIDFQGSRVNAIGMYVVACMGGWGQSATQANLHECKPKLSPGPSQRANQRNFNEMYTSTFFSLGTFLKKPLAGLGAAAVRGVENWRLASWLHLYPE